MTDYKPVGYVYIMQNEHVPGTVKIGYTTNTPKQREGEINAGGRTALPGKWVTVHAWLVENPYPVEQKVHKYFDAMRIKENTVGTEFFKLPAGKTPSEMVCHIHDLLIKWSLTDETKAPDGHVVHMKRKAEQDRIASVQEAKEARIKAEKENIDVWHRAGQNAVWVRRSYLVHKSPVYKENFAKEMLEIVAIGVTFGLSLIPFAISKKNAAKELDRSLRKVKDCPPPPAWGAPTKAREDYKDMVRSLYRSFTKEELAFIAKRKYFLKVNPDQRIGDCELGLMSNVQQTAQLVKEWDAKK